MCRVFVKLVVVSIVPQLRSLRDDYAALEEEGFGVDEKDAARMDAVG